MSLDRERPTSREIEARRPFSAPGGDWSCGMRAGAQLSVRECLKGVRVYGGSQGSVVASPRAADLWILKNTLRKEGNWTKKGVHGVEVLRPQTARAMAAAAAARNAAVAAGLQVKMTMRVWGAWGSMDADDMTYSALDWAGWIRRWIQNCNTMCRLRQRHLCPQTKSSGHIIGSGGALR